LKQGSVQDPADEGLGEADSNSLVIHHGFVVNFVAFFSRFKVKGRVAALESEIKKWKLEVALSAFGSECHRLCSGCLGPSGS